MSDARRLAVIGDGRMGRAVAALAPDHGFVVVALLGERDVRPAGITRMLLGGAEVAVEFTEPDAAPDVIRGCVRAACPVVSGTTGWDAQREALESEVRAAGGTMLWAPNFSPGVHLFARIAEHAALMVAAAAAGFDAHIIETHHSAKVDAPSGTARMLARRISGALNRDVSITSVRTGNVPGDHEIVFDAPFEQVRLSHSARDRRVFAGGALLAARWLLGRQGVFTFDHVLGITP